MAVVVWPFKPINAKNAKAAPETAGRNLIAHLLVGNEFVI
jgi:hypothetical protein